MLDSTEWTCVNRVGVGFCATLGMDGAAILHIGLSDYRSAESAKEGAGIHGEPWTC